MLITGAVNGRGGTEDLRSFCYRNEEEPETVFFCGQKFLGCEGSQTEDS